VALGTVGMKDVKLFSASNIKNGWLHYISKPGQQGNNNGNKEKAQPLIAQPAQTSKRVDQQLTNQNFSIATCCNPIAGDDAIGLVESGHNSLQIHRTKCSRAQELMTVYGLKMVRVNWADHESISFVAEIKVTGIDRQGLSNEITRIISNDLNLNIKSFHIDALNGLTEGSIAFYVKNTADLNDVMDKLNLVEGITHVNRIN